MNLIAVILVLLNSQPIEFKNAKPFMSGNHVMAPLRDVFEKMGSRVKYTPQNDSIEIERGGAWVILFTRNEDYDIQGLTSATPLTKSQIVTKAARTERNFKKPIKKSGRIFVPLRFVAETLGAKVHWNNAKHTVSIITTPAAIQSAGPSTTVIAVPIEVTLKSDKQNYRAGETVSFTITARNTTNENQILHFRSGQSFDITATPAKGSTPSWNWSHDQAFTDALREQTLKPQETITFSATWKQTDDSEKTMPRGVYFVKAKIVADDEIEANKIRIQLNQ